MFFIVFIFWFILSLMEETKTTNCDCSDKNCDTSWSSSSIFTIAVVGMIASLLSFVSLAYVLFGWGIDTAVQKAVNALEIQKVWGPENYALVQKIFASDKFKESQKTQLEWALAQIWADDWALQPSEDNDLVVDTASWDVTSWAAAPAAAEAAAPADTLTPEVLASLKKDAYINGDANADITLIEFSDLQCPFCAKLHNQGTPKAIVEKYGTKVNFIFKHFPLSFHENAQKASEALECVGEIGGSAKFYAFIEAIFVAGNPTPTVVDEAVKKIGVDTTKFATCLASGKYAQKVKDNMNQWSTLFGVKWTPNTVIVNNKTNKFTKLEWAYPTEQFITAIDQMLQ
jgi:protein-disulfide isomerase